MAAVLLSVVVLLVSAAVVVLFQHAEQEGWPIFKLAPAASYPR